MPNRLLFAALLMCSPVLLAACAAGTVSSGGTTGQTVERQGLAPVINSLEPDPAYEGDEVTLHGYFRKLRKDDGLFVSFNGYDSQKVTVVSESELKAVVPEGASSGNVVVVIGESIGKGRFLKVRGKNEKK